MASSSMATTSSALSRRPSSYDVFINFRGEDTRHNFVRLLCDALKRDGIHTFIDSQELWEGEEILPSLLRAIQGSKISIPIFSQRYAESKYCLLELAEIWESHLSEGQTILPIFIGVEPRDVGHQEGSFKKPFEKYQTNCEPAIVEGWKNAVGKIMGWTLNDQTNCEPAIEPAIVEGWKNALRKVGKMKGWTLKGDATTTEQLDIVESVVQRALRELHSSNPLDEEKHLIGIDSHVNELLHLLHNSSDDVRFVGICGMGGLGKTTIAKAMYNRIFRSFNGSSFLTNVREEASQGDKGLVSLQNRLLHDIFTGAQVDISVVFEGSTLIAEKLQREKVLIILDDVNDYKQLEALVGGFDWFGPGSKVIITTRNVHILNVHKKKVGQDIQIYMPRELDSKNSLLLFSLHAFSRNEPPQHYKQLSNEVVRYTGGLPLSLEVLGSFLIDKDKMEWEDTLKILKDIDNDNNVIGNLMEDYDYKVFRRLKISYNRLSNHAQTVFLDVACYFNGWQTEKAISIWEACELCPRLSIKELIQKHLLKIDVPSYGDELVLKMHDQLQAMGRKIALEKSCQDLAKRSRLWSPKEIRRVLKEDTGTQMVEGILIQDDEFEAEDEFVSKDNEFEAKDVLSCEAFQKMPNLRFLEFDGIGSLNGKFAHLPSKLRWFRWKRMKILPPDFYHPELVHLDLSSCVTPQQSWNDPPQNKEKRFPKLKVLNVNFFVGVSLPPDFFLWFPCLQTLNLYRCDSLLEFPDTICRLASLKTINVEYCRPFRKLPDLSKLKELEKLKIRECEELEEIHGLTESLEELDVSLCSKLKKLSDLSKLKKLRSLSVEHCKNIEKIHGLEGIESLEELDTSFCSKLEELPDLSKLKGLIKLKLQSDDLKEIYGLTESLEELDASFCSELKELPDLSKLKRLRKLNIQYCYNLKEIHSLEGIESLEELDARFCSGLKKLPDLSKLKRLRKLKLDCFHLEEIHDLTESLEELDASFCYNLKELPDLSKLKRLRYLNLAKCTNLEEIHGLKGTESLEKLDVLFCSKLKALPDLSKLKRLRKLRLQNCQNLEEIYGLTESLEELDASFCSKLKELPDLSKLKRLRYLHLAECKNLKEIHGLEGTESLEELDTSFCSNLEKLPDLSKLRGLRKLKLQSYYLKEIHGLTESLEELDVSFCSKLKELPDLSKLKRLRKLNIEECKNLEIHGLTESLEELNGRNCFKITETTMKILGQGTLVDRDVGQMQGLNGSPILCVVFAFTPLGLTQWQAGELGTIYLEVDASIRRGKFWTTCLHSIRIEDIKITSQDIIYIHYFKGFDWFGFRLESKDAINKLNATIRDPYDDTVSSFCDVKLVKVLFENKESNQHMPNQQSSAMLVAEFFRWSDADDAEEVEQKGACLEEEDEEFFTWSGATWSGAFLEEEDEEFFRRSDADDAEEVEQKGAYLEEEDEDDKDEDQGRLHQPSHVQEKGKTPLEVKLNNRFNLQESPIQQPNIDNEVQRIPSDIEEAERLIGTNNLFSSSYGGLENRIVFPKRELTKNMREKLVCNFLLEK